LARIFECDVPSLAPKLARLEAAAREEYLEMILGRKVFTRGQDIREWRLYLMIKHVFGLRLPSERTIGALFQTSPSQSRALLRSVMSKHQYDLQACIRSSLADLLTRAQPVGTTPPVTYVFLCDSENEVDALNREVSRLDGRLAPVTRRRSTASTYEMPLSTYQALRTEFAS
jgi:hypothetical protein